MLIVQDLRDFGANVDEGLKRCMGREDFYLRLIKMARSDGNMAKLREAINKNDLEAGFEAAHALKGVLANLALTPVLTPVSEITELLRARTEMDYRPLMEEITAQKAKLDALAAG